MVKNIKKPLQTNKLSSYFLPLPISKTRDYFVSTPYPAPSLTAKHKGKLPTPTRRNIHTDTCQLHYVVGCQPDYTYVITHLSQPQYLIFTRILLAGELSTEYRIRLIYTYAAHLVDKNKQSVFCYASPDITVRHKICTNTVIRYELCYGCLNYVTSIGYFKFLN